MTPSSTEKECPIDSSPRSIPAVQLKWMQPIYSRRYEDLLKSFEHVVMTSLVPYKKSLLEFLLGNVIIMSQTNEK